MCKIGEKRDQSEEDDIHAKTESEETEAKEFTHAIKWNRIKLLHVNEVPEYAQEKDIKTGYRDSLDYMGCIGSIFCLHNETVNIWTHLLGFVFFFYLMVINLIQPQPHIRDSPDHLATIVQLVTYQACMLSSSLFHTFLCHSAQVKRTWQELDHACILIAMFGTYVRIIINHFQCFPLVQLSHLSVVFLLFGSIFYIKYSPWTSSTKVSLPLFFSVALYSVAPFGHWIHLSFSIENSNVDSLMICWMFFPFLLGAVGVLFYVSHFPESMAPLGQVDICGASHQIWHVLIFSGMVSWYYLICWVATTRPTSCNLTCPVSWSDSMLLNSTVAQLLV